MMRGRPSWPGPEARTSVPSASVPAVAPGRGGRRRCADSEAAAGQSSAQKYSRGPHRGDGKGGAHAVGHQVGHIRRPSGDERLVELVGRTVERRQGDRREASPPRDPAPLAFGQADRDAHICYNGVQEESIRLHVSPALDVAELPKDLTISKGAASYSARYRRDKDDIVIDRRFILIIGNSISQRAACGLLWLMSIQS